MPDYRRIQLPGSTYFFTVVTYKRRHILTIKKCIKVMNQVINWVRDNHPFKIDALVLLPEHIHTIWTLPEGDANYKMRWSLIKSRFTKQIKNNLHKEEWLTHSRVKHRESTIWQRRYWEHLIRDEKDYQIHMDYIHFNPVKHGLVQQVKDWPYSTFHDYVKKGTYPLDWGGIIFNRTDQSFGE